MKQKNFSLVQIEAFADGKKKNHWFNPFPDMPIVGSSNSAATKDAMSQCGQMGVQLSD